MARWCMAKQLLREQLHCREPDAHGGGGYVNAIVDVVDELIRCAAGMEWPAAWDEVKMFELYEEDGTPTCGSARKGKVSAGGSRRVAFSPDVVVRTYVPEPLLPHIERLEAEDAADLSNYLDERYGADSDDDDDGS